MHANTRALVEERLSNTPAASSKPESLWFQEAAAAVADIPTNTRVDPREEELHKRLAKLGAWFGSNRGVLRHIFETKGSRMFPIWRTLVHSVSY